MGVHRTWTFICDVCAHTVVTSGGHLPPKWIRLYRRRKGMDEQYHCCSFDCAADVIEEWEEDK